MEGLEAAVRLDVELLREEAFQAMAYADEAGAVRLIEENLRRVESAMELVPEGWTLWRAPIVAGPMQDAGMRFVATVVRRTQTVTLESRRQANAVRDGYVQAPPLAFALPEAAVVQAVLVTLASLSPDF